MKTIPLSQISLALSPFVRAATSIETVFEYAELYKEGKVLPEPVLFKDDEGVFRLADGRHRVEGAMAAGLDALPCEVREGDYSDALQYACASNVEHGLRRSNADKRAVVIAALKEWTRQSDNQLSALCAVSGRFVGLVRKELEESKQVAPTKERLGADGRTLKVPTVNRSQSTTPKDMPARLDPYTEVEYAAPPPMPAPATAAGVSVSPMVRQKIDAIVREAMRLGSSTSSVFTERPFRHLLNELVSLQKLVQGELPGFSEHFAAAKARGTQQEVEGYCIEIGLKESDGTWFFDKAVGCGWKNAGKAIVDWQATCRAWKTSGYFPSQKQGQRNGSHQGGEKPKHWASKEIDAELAKLRRGE